MSEAVRLLHALAHALATLSLYSPGHPATKRAVEQAHQALRALLEVDPRPNFLFLNESAVYAGRALHELSDWPWTRRFSDAAFQRVEFDGRLTLDGMAAFLDRVLVAVASGSAPAADAEPIEGVFHGAVAVLDEELPDDDGAPPEAHVEGSKELRLDLTDEIEAMAYVLAEADRGALARAEAEAIVRILDGLIEAHGLPQAIGSPDAYPATHAVNTALLVMAAATASGMDRPARQRIGLAALLHDIGMALLPADLITRESLTPAERDKVETHTMRGARLLLEGGPGMALPAAVAYEHHLRPDGSGYPAGRLRMNAHWVSSLVGAASAYVALRSPRPFRPAWVPERALRFLEDGAGTVFEDDAARLLAVLVRPT
jgi:HD-GYP domain-containing protein (c-di-GMP phosphodiesterase class II)